MAGSKTTMTAYINAETRQFQSKMDSVNKKLGGIGKGMKMLGGLMAGAFAISKVSAFISETTKLADVQLKAEASLKTALKGNEQAYATLIAQAQKRQQLTLFGDEEIIKAQALAQGILQNADAVQKLTPLAQDLATAKGMQLSQAFELIAKSTGSSTNALARYGIEIKGAVGSNERLESAMKAVGTAFGGQAEAAAKAGLGPLQQLSNAWGDIKEKIGGALVPVINKMAQAVSAFLPTMISGFGKAKGVIVDVINYFIDLYNESAAVRVAVEYIKFTFKVVFEYIKAQLRTTIDAFSGFGKLIGAVLKGDFEAIPGIFKSTMDSMKGNYVEMGQNMGDAFKEGIGNIVKKEKIAFIGLDDSILPEAQAMGAKIGTAMSEGIKQTMSPVGGSVQGQGLQNPISSPSMPNALEGIDFSPVANQTGQAVDSLEKMREVSAKLKPVFAQLTTASVNGSKEMAKAAGNSAQTIIKAAIAKGIASAISGVLQTIPGPWGVGIAAVAGAAAGALFNAVIPSFATGGMAYGPTLAMVGDNPGAGTDPEIIAPLSKLQGMTPSVNLIGDWKLNGDSLQFVLDEYNRTLNTTH